MLRSPVFRLSMLFPALMLAFCIAIMYGPVTFSMKDVANAILAGYWHSDTAGTLHQRTYGLCVCRAPCLLRWRAPH